MMQLIERVKFSLLGSCFYIYPQLRHEKEECGELQDKAQSLSSHLCNFHTPLNTLKVGLCHCQTLKLLSLLAR